MIIPKNLSAVQIYVWYGGTRLSYNLNNCSTTYVGYLCLNTQQGLVTGTRPTAVEVSSSGYDTVTINNPTFNTHGNCYISLIPKLYAWKNGSTIVYTTSATPSNGDRYYNDDGKAYDQYELTVNDLSLFLGIASYDSTNNLIKISGDPA